MSMKNYDCRNVWEPHEDNHLVFDTHISGNNVPIDAQIVADDTSEKCSFTASTKMLGHDPSIPVKSIEGVNNGSMLTQENCGGRASPSS
jgi:hypothetical protein